MKTIWKIGHKLADTICGVRRNYLYTYGDNAVRAVTCFDDGSMWIGNAINGEYQKPIAIGKKAKRYEMIRRCCVKFQNM